MNALDTLITKRNQVRAYNSYRKAGWSFEKLGHTYGDKTVQIYSHTGGSMAVVIVQRPSEEVVASRLFSSRGAFDAFFADVEGTGFGGLGYDLSIAYQYAQKLGLFCDQAA